MVITKPVKLTLKINYYGSCLSLMSAAVMNTMTKAALRGKALFGLQLDKNPDSTASVISYLSFLSNASAKDSPNPSLFISLTLFPFLLLI